MNRNLIDNIKLSKDEKVYYDFNKLKGKNSDCRMVLTTKRLIIYNDGNYLENKRKVRRKGINEIQRSTITHMSYFIEHVGGSYLKKLLGFIFALVGLVGAVLTLTKAAILPILTNLNMTILEMWVSLNDVIYYGGSLILIIIGLIMLFKTNKTLLFKVVSGHMDDIEIQLDNTKYNQEAVRRISTKLYV